MKVVLVAEQLRRRVPGGIGTYVTGLRRGLGQLPGGPDIEVLSSALPSRLLVAAWDRGLLPVRSTADVVHATSLAVPPHGLAPLSAMVHDLAWRRLPDAYPPRGRRWHEAALGRALARADLLLVPSRHVAADLEEAGGKGRVEVVEEGCDHLPPPDGPAADGLLRGLGVVGPFLLSVSTVEPRKNLARLVEAYALARSRLPEPWPLVIVGPAGWGPALDRGTAPVGVVPAGAVADAVLAALYGRARLVAYVPLHEGWGLPAVEAMAAGAPVVASPVPSTGGAALEVDPTRVDSIADGLVAGATDETVRAGLVAAGAARAGRLTWAACAARHVELWKAAT